jgi:hypothetical protein
MRGRRRRSLGGGWGSRRVPVKQGGVQMDGGKDLELRDWLAGQALVGILMNPNTCPYRKMPLWQTCSSS